MVKGWNIRVSPFSFRKVGVMINLKKLGKCCRDYRKTLGISQTTVAEEIHYTTQAVSHFEKGNNDSFSLVSWYLLHGLTFDDLVNGGVFNEIR